MTFSNAELPSQPTSETQGSIKPGALIRPRPPGKSLYWELLAQYKQTQEQGQASIKAAILTLYPH